MKLGPGSAGTGHAPPALMVTRVRWPSGRTAEETKEPVKDGSGSRQGTPRGVIKGLDPSVPSYGDSGSNLGDRSNLGEGFTAKAVSRVHGYLTLCLTQTCPQSRVGPGEEGPAPPKERGW